MVTFVGSGGNDTLDASTGTITGFSGGTVGELQDLIGDTIEGDLNADYVVAGDGDDEIYAMTASNADGSGVGDTLKGAGGHDTITGSGGVDTLIGGDGDDVLAGRDGTDSLFGEAGNDTFNMTAGHSVDNIDGGSGTDALSLEGFATETTTVDLGAGTYSVTGFGSGSITSVESVKGGGASDTILGASANEDLKGGGGDDVIWSEDGNDTVKGGGGADELKGGGGVDTLVYDNSTAVNINLETNSASGGDAAGDTISGFENVGGGSNNDTLTGANGVANALYGFDGADSISGNSGNDTIRGGSGADSLDGGADSDTLDYSDAGAKVTVRLWNQTATDSIATGDTIAGFENVFGGSGGDAIVGSDAVNNRLVGNDGNDVLHGLSGNDTLEGKAGDDTMRGGAGADVMSGGTGIDTLDYSDSSNGVKVRLWNQTATDGLATGDAIAGIENVLGGSSTDALVGSDGVGNVLSGNGGNDNMQGRSGNDTLIGGSGKDTLTGGADNDTFEFAGAFGIDRITDFEGGAGAGDVIRLIGLGTPFDSFAEVMAVTTQSGANTIISFAPGLTITLLNFTAATLNADDFVFG